MLTISNKLSSMSMETNYQPYVRVWSFPVDHTCLLY